MTRVDLALPAEALARLAEVRRAAPAAKVVILSSTPDASWLADALRAEASAVLPGSVAPHTLAIVLREVMAAREPLVALPAHGLLDARPEAGITVPAVESRGATHRHRTYVKAKEGVGS